MFLYATLLIIGLACLSYCMWQGVRALYKQFGHWAWCYYLGIPLLIAGLIFLPD